jgi:hypothetical protein
MSVKDYGGKNHSVLSSKEQFSFKKSEEKNPNALLASVIGVIK